MKLVVPLFILRTSTWSTSPSSLVSEFLSICSGPRGIVLVSLIAACQQLDWVTHLLLCHTQHLHLQCHTHTNDWKVKCSIFRLLSSWFASLHLFGVSIPPPTPTPTPRSPFLFTMVLNRIAFHCSALRGMGCVGCVCVLTRVRACMCMFVGGGGGYASFLFSGSFHNTDLAKIRKSTMCSFKTSVLFFSSFVTYVLKYKL